MKKSAVILVLFLGIFVAAGMIFAQWAPVKEAAPATTAKASEGFAVSRMVISGGVENMEPVDVKETFPAATEKVWCFIEARDIAEDTTVSVIWYHGDKELLKTDLSLKKGPKWRTYANKNLRGLKGSWKVELKDSKGNSVKSVTFKVE